MPAPATLNVKPEIKQRIEALADQQHRPAEELVAEALDEYIAGARHFDEVIRSGIAEADAGQFATTEEVDAFFAKHAGSA